MSCFFSKKYSALIPYVPGEQPQDRKYIKLNTNESPFPPSPSAQKYAKAEAEKLMLYSDPDVRDLVRTASEKLGVNKDEIIFTNGSDDILNFAFMAFCDDECPAFFADITYGFYKVFANLNNVKYTEIPLKSDYTINVDDYIDGKRKTIFIANPNAPTGISLPLSEIEKVVKNNPENIVVVDEAYVDFGGESAIPLTKKYKNLLVTRTFSKSRSLAGGRLGFGVADKELIRDLNTIRFSTNPYNINRMTMAAGIGALEDEQYFNDCTKAIIETRAWTTRELEKLGFTVLDSRTNFVFAKSDKIGGKDLYLELKERGILVRHFETERLRDFNRITIGSAEEMKTFIETVKKISEDKK